MRRALAEIKAGPKNRESTLGAILCPKPVSLDEWQSYAIASQAKLMADTRDDPTESRPADPAPVPQSDPLLSTAVHAKESPTWIRS